MAEFHFLKGTFRGRLGDVVWSSWRGKEYAKVYTPPANPRTEKQERHRTTWGLLGHIAHFIYKPVLKPYTFPKPHTMTAFNAFLHINKELFEDFDAEYITIFDDGQLLPSSFLTFTYDSTAKKLKATWSTAITGNMKPTDKAIVVLIQYDAAVAYGVSTRSAGSLEIDPAIFQNIESGSGYAFLVFAQPPSAMDTAGMNSATLVKRVTITGLRAKKFDEIGENVVVTEGKEAVESKPEEES